MTIHKSDTSSNTAAVLKVERPFYQQQELNNVLDYNHTKDGNNSLCSNPLRNMNLLKFLQSIFPIFSWLPQYDLKKDLISDIISGSTVSVMHIPQGFFFTFSIEICSLF